jgi:hypothetical protein
MSAAANSNERSIAIVAESAENSIAESAESSLAESAEMEKTFSSILDNDYDQREKSNSSSFRVYLNLIIFLFNKETLTLRDVIRFIENQNYAKAEATLQNSTLEGEDLVKLKRGLYSRASDFIFSMGNKILEFLHDLKEQTLAQNVDYLGLLSSIDEEEKGRLTNSIYSVAENARFKGMIIPQQIADEKLYLSVTSHRKGLLKLKDVVMKTISSKASDPEVIDLTCDHFPGYNVSEPQITKIRQLYCSYRSEIGMSISSSSKRKRKRLNSNLTAGTGVRASERIIKNNAKGQSCKKRGCDFYLSSSNRRKKPP